MRVALLSPAYRSDTGVVGRDVQALARAIENAGSTVELVRYGPRLSRRPGGGSECTLTTQLPLYLRRHAADYDIVHAHGEGIIPLLLLASGPLPHFVFTPDYYASAQTHLRRISQGRHHRMDGPVLSAAERVLCVSRIEALQVRRYAPRARATVIPNGFDAAEIAEARPFDVTGQVIVSVDRLTRWAGIHRVISALPALPETYSLVVVGRGYSRGMLEAHADYLGVADRVRFVGAVGDQELYRWLRSAAVVATLKEESLWGGTLLAAACAGAPIVASDIAANREAALLADRDGISFVSRRASPFVLAEAVLELVEGRRHSTTSHLPSWSDVAEQTMAVYREVTDGGR